MSTEPAQPPLKAFHALTHVILQTNGTSRYQYLCGVARFQGTSISNEKGLRKPGVINPLVVLRNAFRSDLELVFPPEDILLFALGMTLGFAEELDELWGRDDPPEALGVALEVSSKEVLVKTALT